jgi:hypothetical protein
MRVVHVVAIAAAALLLSSSAGAQGIGDLAARERSKRKPGGTSTRVITEDNIGGGVAQAPASSQPATPVQGVAAVQDPAAGSTSGAADAAAPAGDAAAADPSAGPAEEEKPLTLEEQMQKESEERAKVEQAWRTEIAQLRQEAQQYQDYITRLQAELSDYRSGYNTPGRATRQTELEATQKKLADAQARIEGLESTGRRAGYR